jgi:hypothetical protein
MTTFSYSQQQLLSVLQISPLRLTLPAVATIATGAAVAHTVPDLTLPLAQDIRLLLEDRLQWCIDNTLTTSQLQGNQLLTPPLDLLQQAAQKKALWALVISYHEN